MPKAEEFQEQSLKEWFDSINSLYRFVLRKWWFIVLGGLLGGIIGIAYAWIQKPKYEALLSFALDDKTAGVGGAFSLASELGLGGGGRDVFAGDNITVILTSRRMIERVLLMPDSGSGKVQTLMDYWIDLHKKEAGNDPQAKRLTSVNYPVGLDREKFSYLQDSILYSTYLDFNKSKLNISKPDRRLNYYEVRFTGPDERFSKIFVEKLVAETKDFYTEIRSRKSREALEILENRVASIKGTARGAIRTQSSAAIRDANINPAYITPNPAVAQSQIDVTAYGQAYEELFKMMEMARYQYLNDIPLLQVIDEPHYPMKLIKLGRKKAGLIGGLVMGGLALIIVIILWIRKRFLLSIASEKGIDGVKF